MERRFNSLNDERPVETRNIVVMSVVRIQLDINTSGMLVNQPRVSNITELPIRAGLALSREVQHRNIQITKLKQGSSLVLRGVRSADYGIGCIHGTFLSNRSNWSKFLRTLHNK